MTPPDLPGRTHPAVAPPAAPVQVRDQGELIAAIPALIGFHPHDSLVLLATGGESGRRIGLTMRIDLPPPEHAAEVGAAVVRGLLLDSPTGAVVVVVTPDGPGRDGHGGTSDPPHRPLVTQVLAELGKAGVEVHTAVWTPATTAGARWRCYDRCGCSGELPDPASSPVLTAAVVGGQVVHADRTALERLVSPAGEEGIRRREELLIQAVDRELDADPGPAPGTDLGAELAAVEAALADAEAGCLVLDDERVVTLATALAAPAVRDAALMQCLGPRADAAEHLWAALARETPDPEAAEPAALLAVSALLRGDGALANVALDRAERAWPGHRLSGLLRVAAEAGVRPGELRQWLGCTPRVSHAHDACAGGSA